MSWFSTNYEKAMLGGCAVVALTAAYFGWSHLGAIDADLSGSLKGRGDDNAAVAGAERVDRSLQSLGLDHGLKQGITADGRAVDLFSGVPLFVERDNKDTAIDIVKGREVHAGIPNSFWLENHIDPGFADSPQRDPDGDGFSNLEEFTAKTAPTDPKSHPELISKLRYVGDDSVEWVLQPKFGDGNQYPINYFDTNRGKNKAPLGEGIKAGEVFYKDGAAKGRFKLLGSEVREVMNPSTKVAEKVTFLKIEDLKPNKKAKGVTYEFPSPMSDAKIPQFKQYDRKAVFRLEAIGQEGKEFSIDEFTAFALPDGAADKRYQLIEVTPDAVVVEYRTKDGQNRTVNIPKGGLPAR